MEYSNLCAKYITTCFYIFYNFSENLHAYFLGITGFLLKKTTNDIDTRFKRVFKYGLTLMVFFKKKKRVMSQLDTKTRILDGAEQLFAREGFHNTSLRALTQLANVNLASVNYHFGSKHALLHAVIERRLLPLNEIRAKEMEAVITHAKERGTKPSAEALLRAFIEPTLEFKNSGPGARDFISLIGRSLSEPDETVRNCFLELILPNFHLLFDGLHEALPQLSSAVLLARLQFIMGTLSHVMSMGTLSSLQDPNFPHPLEQSELIEQLIKYAHVGLEAPE